MIVKFKKIRFKNILSTGNVFTEIDYTKNKTTLIVGGNGAGKSTMLDALVFGLYGKPFRKINKSQLLNSINGKELLVEVDFSIANDDYMVRRGIKPNIFEIWKNGEMLNQEAATKDQQVYLEQNILKMNVKTFGQIVILGSATYVPFMQLAAANRREVIEDLLDIQIFSTMNVLLKQRVSDNKIDIQDHKHSLMLIENKIETAKDTNETIRKMKQVQVSGIKDKVKVQLKTIEEENEKIEKLQNSIDELMTTITDKADVKGRIEKLKTLRQDIVSKKNTLAKEVTFYDSNDNCPTCKQGIEHDFKEHTVSEKSTKIQEMNTGLTQLEAKLDGLTTRLEEISGTEDRIQTHNFAISEHRGNVRMAKTTLLNFQKDLENAEQQAKEVDESLLVAYGQELTEKQKLQEKAFEEAETLGVVATMLKDGGIKTRIIKQYVPVMNQLINKFLAAFDLFVDFQLDESFNETIKSRFRDDFTYMSFSEGEKTKIDISLMLTWRAVSKMRNSVTTNLLVMDEIFDGSIDATGIDNLIKILNKLNEHDNIFVISHKGDVIDGLFEEIIKFEKVKNFSRIAE